MSIMERPRAAFYIDGFNLYHGIDDLGKPYLKWLSLMKLSMRLAGTYRATVSEVVFCTAYFPKNFEKRKRHEDYNRALEAEGVKVLLGHTINEPMKCNGCERRWDQPREKETDINVALSLYEGARLDIFDIAFLVTADTDQASTLRFMKRSFPEKRVIVLTPPSRRKSAHLTSLCEKNIQLSETDIDACVLPAMITPDSGRLITRPLNYAPPANWVHPDERKV